MKQDVEKHIRIAENAIREMEHLMAGGFHKAVMKQAYQAMLSAATAALLARDIQCSSKQAIVSDFNKAFVKTGLLDVKFNKYFRQASNFRPESDDPSFASADYRQAQTNLIMAKEFITACRSLCD